MSVVDDPRELIIALLNAADKSSAEAICRRLVLTDEFLADLILAAQMGELAPYRYASHFEDYAPVDAQVESIDLAPIAASPVGPLSKSAQKSFKRIDHLFRARRMFSAHLLYAPSHSHWHLFYFDQRDRQLQDNHWKLGGPHIHYSRECYTSCSLIEVWRSLQASPPEAPGHTYIRYMRR
ncbi:MAG: hypothetical protein IPP44_24980 [Ideonella sp.]|nr:hypothetical protein [Ideonella sp.]